MKRSILLFTCSFLVASSFAQGISSADLKELRKREDSLKTIAYAIVNDREATGRFHNNEKFIPMLVRALKIKNSFSYPFDSLQSISRLYAPDSSFRIFTWQVMKDEAVFRRMGAIQMKTTDGSLKLFPLIDKSHISENQDTITDNNWWFGCIYYNIVMHKVGKQKLYTLFGYDENSIRSTKKRLEVLRFTDDGRPVFGAPIFSFEEDTIPKKTLSRFSIEYKKDGRARMIFDTEQNMIIYDHLISETNEPGKRYTLVPDGDYEGFKWVNNRWVHVEKVYTFKLQDGQFPIGVPLYDNKKQELNKGSKKRN
jgi:hypothetical protein